MADLLTKPPTVHPVRAQRRWLYDPLTDMVLTWSWLPLFLVAHVLTGRTGPGADVTVQNLLTGVLVISLLHQPLTLLLVYGDRRQFAERRRLFTIAPVVALIAVGVAVGTDLAIVVPIAAVWQNFHTLQQRYGLLRIYARKSAYGGAGLDRAVLYVPFLAAVAVVGLMPVTESQLARFGAGIGGNAREVDMLLDGRPVLVALLVPLAVATVVVVARYAAQELRAVRHGTANPVKWNYLAASFALLAALLVDPTAGVAAFVAAHAVEYTVVVARTLRTRYGAGTDRGSLLSVLAGSTARRWLLLCGFLSIFWLIDVQLRDLLPARVYLIAVSTIGLLHFVYDAVIWKVRRPAVAATFGVDGSPAGGRDPSGGALP